MEYQLLPYDDVSFETAIHSVERTMEFQAQALSGLCDVYANDATDTFARTNLEDSLRVLHHTAHVKRGKIVVCGVGKLYKIGLKLVATFNSLSIHAQGLHPTEALHGDLGLVNESRDCIIFITASGNTPELIQLLPHLDRQIPILLLTSNKGLKLAMHPRISSLLYAPLNSLLNEEAIHGLPAPTVLATLALVLADAVILALLEIIESDLLERKRRFSTKHPGGSIGLNLSHLNTNLSQMVPLVVSRDQQLGSSLSSCLALSIFSLEQARSCVESLNSPSLETNANKALASHSTRDKGSCVEGTNASLFSENEEPDISLYSSISAAPALVVGLILHSKVSSVLDSENELELLQWIACYDYIVFSRSRNTFAAKTALIRTHYVELSKDQKWAILSKRVLGEFKLIACSDVLVSPPFRDAKGFVPFALE